MCLEWLGSGHDFAFVALFVLFFAVILCVTVMSVVSFYCTAMAFLFIILAIALMKRLIRSSNMSGVATNPVVICRLLGSGTVFFVSYLVQVK